jgi:acyl-CoA synthetase (AMP-forming)/AMP-acid ligase II
LNASSNDGIAAVAAEDPQHVAVMDDEGSVTFGELDARQRAVVGLLRSSDVAVGDFVAVLSSNRREYLEVTIGCLRAGIVPVPINPLLQPAEVAYILEDCGARWLFTDRDVDPALEIEHVVRFGEGYEGAIADAPSADIGDHAATRPMHYTSGTTGRPKGVFVAPVDAVEARRRSLQFRSPWGLKRDEVHLVCSPLGHSAPHRFALRTLESGGTVILNTRFDPQQVLRRIRDERVTSTFMVPTHLERLLPVARANRRDLSSMRLLAHAGAPISEATKLETLRVFPAPAVWEFYGSTEGPATRISATEWLGKRGSVGRPTGSAEIWVRDEDFRPLAPGEVGQVWVKDDDAEHFVYWNADEKTRDAWRDGAYTVGDLGWLDGDGFLFLTGRKHDTIISGGVNVYPQEVELVLSEHPAVAEAVVYGIASAEWGQEVRARAVLLDDADPEEVLAWLRARVAHYKCPRSIEVVGSLDRTATGKLKRPNAEPGN